MIAADRELIATVILWVLQIASTLATLLFDERRLGERELERAWPPASRTLFAVYLGPLALFFHFWRTRAGFLFWRTKRGWKAPLYAVLSTLLLTLALEVPALVLEHVFDLPP